MGVAAMLRNQWQDVPFRIGSLGDRAIVAPDDNLLVVAAPDPQGPSPELRNKRMGLAPATALHCGCGWATLTRRGARAGLSDVLRMLAAAEDRPVVMFNPRLARCGTPRPPNDRCRCS
jgi:hypothetical protein